MIRPFHLALAALLLAGAGCTFERRPAAGGAAEDPDTAAAVEGDDATGLGVSAAQRVEEARSFFHEFQGARARGRLSEVRAALHPRAVLLLGSRRLTLQGSGTDVRALLKAPGGEGAAPARIEEIGAVGPGVLVVTSYPRPDGTGTGPVETLLLVPDPAGWSVRLLQRGAEPPR